jgi:hypothetical protein
MLLYVWLHNENHMHEYGDFFFNFKSFFFPLYTKINNQLVYVLLLKELPNTGQNIKHLPQGFLQRGFKL